MSISKVGTKKEVGAEAIRSRNLVQGVNDMECYHLPFLDVRMVSGNTVVQHDFVLLTLKKPWLAPTELVHLFREHVLSKNLFSTAVSTRKNYLVLQRPTAPTRSNENGRPSLYALRTFLNLTRGKDEHQYQLRPKRKIHTGEAACREQVCCEGSRKRTRRLP